MKNTIIYIDGGNLYYGQLRGSANKWLDLEAFSAKLLNPDHAIAAVKYFTSRVIDKSADQCHTQRQSQYLTALATRPLVKIIEGRYREQSELLAPVQEPCTSCDRKRADGRIKVRRITEKMTDVNIADAMLRDAYERRTECLVLISGDTDLAPIVKTVRYHVGIPVLVFNPQRSICNELRRYATFYRNIPQGSADGCRLPDSFETSDGRTIRCPAAWMPGRTGDS
jgi:uncharacterized LabA/DUF88 family protein